MAIFFAALLIRIIYFLQIKSNFPGWDAPTIDPLYHDLWARQIASGDLLGQGPFFRAPFYAYFLGLIYAFGGPSLMIAKIIQHIIGAFSCSLIFLFTDKFIGRRTAILAGVISVFYWVFIYFEDELLLDSLLVPLSIILIWSLLTAAEKGAKRGFLISGLILGLASITRPNFLIMIPAGLLWLFFRFRGNYKFALSRFMYLTIGAIIIISPVTLRNIIVGHDAVLIASQGGINFYIGNNRYADGATAKMPEFGPTWQYADCEYLAMKETGNLGKQMKASEVSSFYLKKSLKFIYHEPSRWLKLMFRKLMLFWNGFEISNNQNLYFFRRFASVTYLLQPIFFIISPLSLLGLWLLIRLGGRLSLIAYFILAYMLTVIMFFINSRFRLPVIPFLIILATFAVRWIWEIVRRRDYKKIIIAVISLMVLFFATNKDFYRISKNGFAMSHFSLGNVYLKKGMLDKAMKEYSTAAGMAPCVPSAHVNMGIIYFSSLEFDKAREQFEKELETCGESAKAHNNLSVLYRLNGDNQKALVEADRAIYESPQNLESYVNKILALRSLGDDSLAYLTADSLTITFPEYLPGHYFKGKMALDRNDPALAEREFKFVINRGPENILEKYDLSTIYSSQTPYGYKPEKMPGLAYYELGLLEVSRGQIDSALTYFLNTTRILPDYPDGWTNLALAYDHKKMYKQALAAYKKSTDIDPDNPLTLYDLGLTLGKVGMFSEAADVFKIALSLKPDFPEARVKLKIAESLRDSLSKK